MTNKMTEDIRENIRYAMKTSPTGWSGDTTEHFDEHLNDHEWCVVNENEHKYKKVKLYIDTHIDAKENVDTESESITETDICDVEQMDISDTSLTNFVTSKKISEENGSEEIEYSIEDNFHILENEVKIEEQKVFENVPMNIMEEVPTDIVPNFCSQPKVDKMTGASVLYNIATLAVITLSVYAAINGNNRVSR